jgi:O-antigen/teichoic acid export membrane protein
LIALLVIGELCVGIYQIYVYVIYLFERTWIQPLLFGVLACLNLGLNLLLVPRIGILGAAATTCGAYLLQAAFIVLYTRRLLRIDIDWEALLKIIAGGVAVFVATWFAPGKGIAYILLSMAIGIMIYIAVLGLTRAVRIGDLKRILGLADSEPEQ